MQETKQNRLGVTQIILSLLFFTVLWSIVSDAWGYSSMLFGEGPDSTQKIIYGILSRGIWVLPVFFLFRRYNSQLPLSLKTMFTNRFQPKLLLICSLIFTVLVLGSSFISYGEFRINPNFIFAENLIFYLVVGIVEELVYRGWALNALLLHMPPNKANLVSALFFILLHWPSYFIKLFTTGEFLTANFISQSVTVFVLGMIFGYMFQKDKSLVTPILFHGFYDIIVAAFNS